MNSGSTGQPRGGDPEPIHAPFDSETNENLSASVPYDSEKDTGKELKPPGAASSARQQTRNGPLEIGNSMFCTQCGTKLDDGARFCTSCCKPVAHPPVEDTFTAQQPRYDQSPPAAETAEWAGAQEIAVPHRRLRRIRVHKKIAGVCAGFTEYFDMDVTLMRLIWVGLLLIPPHVGLIAYIIAWAVLPKV